METVAAGYVEEAACSCRLEDLKDGHLEVPDVHHLEVDEEHLLERSRPYHLASSFFHCQQHVIFLAAKVIHRICVALYSASGGTIGCSSMKAYKSVLTGIFKMIFLW